MKVITIQEGNKMRVAMIPETAADEFIMKALRYADGNQTKVIPLDTSELERVTNPYKESGHAIGKSKQAVIIELTVDRFPKLIEAEDEVFKTEEFAIKKIV
ncbi:MAG: hypothetical protein JWO06_2238 [Bacteroidota bacterium]|nr:hypothetical protein [Bacteroidota bacterium]